VVKTCDRGLSLKGGDTRATECAQRVLKQRASGKRTLRRRLQREQRERQPPHLAEDSALGSIADGSCRSLALKLVTSLLNCKYDLRERNQLLVATRRVSQACAPEEDRGRARSWPQPYHQWQCPDDGVKRVVGMLHLQSTRAFNSFAVFGVSGEAGVHPITACHAAAGGQGNVKTAMCAGA
jgi:hypothetical protein